MKKRDFKDKDFAQFHPGGSLGRRLLTKVGDVMKKENLPLSHENTKIQELIQIISKGRLGLVVVLDNGEISGIITDGDIRRAMETKENSFFQLRAKDLMSKNPKIVDIDEKLITVQAKMTENKVNSLLVTEKNCFVGVIQIYDLTI